VAESGRYPFGLLEAMRSRNLIENRRTKLPSRSVQELDSERVRGEIVRVAIRYQKLSVRRSVSLGFFPYSSFSLFHSQTVSLSRCLTVSLSGHPGSEPTATEDAFQECFQYRATTQRRNETMSTFVRPLTKPQSRNDAMMCLTINGSADSPGLQTR
jgi:hypothetical protein